MAIPTRPQPSTVAEKVAKPPRMAMLVGLAAALVIALVLAFLAVWFRGEADRLRGSAAASNDALVDAGPTAQVSEQVRDAVQRVFSYDFARLEDNERAAADVITGSFVRKFTEDFARVRELAPSQQAVVVATVPALAVKRLDGDRAILVVFLDQSARQGGQAKPLVATGRLTVTAQRVEGRWKIADAELF